MRPFPLLCLSLFVLLFAGSACKKEKTRKPIKLDEHYSILPLDLKGDKPDIKNVHKIELTEERIRLTKEYFRKHNFDLWRYLPKEDVASSIRFQPQIVVVHYTVIPTLEETVEYFKPDTIDGARETVAANGALNVGIQFIVDRDGTIYSSYPFNVMARHTIGLNHVAVGIENIGNADLGTADGNGVLPLTEAQLEANEAIVRWLCGEAATMRYLIGHHEYRELENKRHPASHLFQEDIPGYRTDKVDPGPNFMRELRKRLGVKVAKKD